MMATGPKGIARFILIWGPWIMKRILIIGIIQAVIITILILQIVSPPPDDGDCGLSSGSYSTTQQDVIKKAWAAVQQMHPSDRVTLALFEAGFVESSMRNMANSKVPSSLKIPHDG